MSNGRLKFQAMKAIFYVLSGVNAEQRLLERTYAVLGHHLRMALVYPVLDLSGQHTRAAPNSSPVSHRAYISSECEYEELDGDVDPSVGGHYIEGEFDSSLSASVSADDYEYCVILEFLTKPQHRDPQWTYRIFNDNDCRRVGGVTHADTVPDADIVSAMFEQSRVIKGEPRLQNDALHQLLCRRFKGSEDEVAVQSCIRTHIHPHNDRRQSSLRLLEDWRREVTSHQQMRRRLQPARCSPSWGGRPFIAPYKTEWQQWLQDVLQPSLSATTSSAAASSNWRRTRPLVLIGPGGIGKTRYAQRFGPHIYMNRSLKLRHLHDCLEDGEARYIIIDDVPWQKLMETYGASILTNQEFTWNAGGRSITTKQTLPVILLQNVLQGMDAKCWQGQGGWFSYWKEQLQIVKLDSRPLYINEKRQREECGNEGSNELQGGAHAEIA